MDDPFPAGMVDSIAALLKDDHKRPRGFPFYSEVFDDPLMFPLQRRRELEKMMCIAGRINPKVVYEIGSDKAGGLYHWCKSLPTVERVIACEIRGTPYAKAFESAFPYLDFLWLPQSSYHTQTVNQVRNWLEDDRIDCLFIDGEKAEFLRDFYVYLPLMSPNGIVFMHDIQDSPGPKDAFERIVDRGYRMERIIDITESKVAVSREEAGDPPASAHERWLRHWRGRSCGVGVIYLSGE